MNNVFLQRKSIRKYDTTYKISKEQWSELFAQTLRTPSSKNLQHWRFLVFEGENVQNDLFTIANEQKMVREASAVIAVLGDLEAPKNAEIMYNELIEKGEMDVEGKESRMRLIHKTYDSRGPLYPRDAANSNAGLASMQLMLVAESMGLSTCPIGGFNKEKFIERFNIEDRYIPVMLIAIGKGMEKGKETIRLREDQLVEYIRE